MKRIASWTLMFFIAASAPALAGAAGQREAPSGVKEAQAGLADEGLLAEMASLNRTMGAIAGLLDELLRGQRADLLMKRIQIASRGLGDLERRLEGARDERRSLENNIRQMEAEIERLDAQAEEQDQPGLGQESQALKETKDIIDHQLALMTTQLQAAESRVLDLENDLAGRLDDLAAWEELVDKAIGLR